MSKIESFVTTINPNALQEINRTVIPSDPADFGDKHMALKLRDRAAKLIGSEAMDFLRETGINVEIYDAKTDALGKLDDWTVFGFRHLGREVFFHPAQTADDKIQGIAVSYWLDDENTALQFHRYQESREKLGNDTVAFLRFLGNFVQRIDNNLILEPSDEQRRRVYKKFFEKHGPLGHDVYIDNQRVITRQKDKGGELQPII